MVALASRAMRNPLWPLVLAGLLFAVELAVIGIVFKHGIQFDCGDNWSIPACTTASLALIALYCAFGALLLYWVARASKVADLLSNAGAHRWPLALNAIGFLICLIPVAFLQNGAGTAELPAAFLFWSLGMMTLLCGLALYVAPASKWRGFLRQEGLPIFAIMSAGAFTPWLAVQIQALWQLEDVAQLTFDAVAFVVSGLGYVVENPAGTKVIGTENFAINIAASCSGIEGIALVLIFVSLYVWLFRKDLRFPHVFLLYPIGLAASALLNVVRISVLLVIGLEGNPDLAIGGFHSHAGWLLFTLIALGIVGLAQTVPALRTQHATVAQNAATTIPFFQDPVVAKILPFAVFMLSALFASAFTQNPSVVYPLRAIAMGSVLWLFMPFLRSLPWRLDPIAIAAGLAIGLMWVIIPVDPSDGPPPFGALTGTLLVAWFILRGIGTIVFVPIIEELFFRGYLEARLRFGAGRSWVILSAVVTAVLFAALHSRWAEAFIASLIFSWIMHRRQSVTDAIMAHAVANLLVFATAIMVGNFDII